ncbi:hypothetical protein EPN52_11860 [bacterium]|nr:MAG: hypothetical protein EPN52_11860 [bacterium]
MTEVVRRYPALTRGAAAIALAIALLLGAIAPSQAETTGARSTRNIILGAVAATTAIVLYNNYHHKQLAHNTVVGYTRNGGTVYADGRVVYPNGQTYYLSNNGQNLCNYYGDNDGDEQCGPSAQAYTWHHDNGLHRGWYKHHGRHGGDRDDYGDND